MSKSKHNERLKRFESLKHACNIDSFEEMLEIREKDVYEGRDVDVALDVMEVLDEFYDKLEDTISDKGLTNYSFGMVYAICEDFHKLGEVVEKF